MIIFVSTLLTQANPNGNIFQKIITHFVNFCIVIRNTSVSYDYDFWHILSKMSKTYDANIRQAVHNNNVRWNPKQLPRVLKSNYSKRFPKNRPWQSSCSNVLIKKASNKIDFENGYSVKYQSCIYDSVKHLWWSFFAKTLNSS